MVCCLITHKNIANARSLHEIPHREWGEGATLMFHMASPVDRESVFARFLSELGWEIPARPRLFVQLNNSEVLNEFIRIVLSPLRTMTEPIQ